MFEPHPDDETPLPWSTVHLELGWNELLQVNHPVEA